MFADEFPEAAAEWHRESNFVVVLQAADEEALWSRYARCRDVVHRAIVTEPDLTDEHTAFAALGSEAGRILSDLPLCLKAVAMA